MTQDTSKPHTKGSHEEQEKKRKHDMKVGLTADKAQIGALAGTGAGIAAGAAIGSIVPGLGTAIGAAIGGTIGAVTGALGGTAIGSAIDAKEHEAYWREHYVARPYSKDYDYAMLEPAYRHGWEARSRHDAKTGWDDVEPDLSRDWDSNRGPTGLEWKDARHASRDAWDHAERRASATRET
jgi:hypothetical protein